LFGYIATHLYYSSSTTLLSDKDGIMVTYKFEIICIQALETFKKPKRFQLDVLD
jgi:hypothetical protein